MFALTPKQAEAQAVLASDARHLMLFGGSRSGKTFLLVRNVIMRALKAPHSRHLIARFRFNALRASIIEDTLPKVMRIAFPGLTSKMDREAWFLRLPNGSEVWFAGLDDKDRTEKILGMEFVTIYLNECSQISFDARNTVITRLAQSVEQVVQGMAPITLKPRVYYDENPPSRAHWTFRLFVEKLDPETRQSLSKPDDHKAFKINPADNRANIADDYLETLEAMPARYRRRFLDGEFADATPGALFTEEMFDRWRHEGEQPAMVRIAIAIDPSGSGDVDNADNDAIGIVAAGLGTDGNAYILEDCTVKAGPATWGAVAVSAFDRHSADVVVGEINFGGAMVGATIQAARPRTPFRQVTASRGKHVRAEPFSALFETGKVRMAGRFVELEDELTAFTTNGYLGSGSPNRADAAIWALAELFPAITRPAKKEASPVIPSMAGGFRGR